MADMRVLVGDPAYYNLLSRAVLSSSGSDALFPVTNLCDQVPGTIHKYASIAADQEVRGDLQQIANGGFETPFVGQLPTAAWTSASYGTGMTERDTANTHAGSLGALKCDVGPGPAGSSLAGVRYVINVRAGEKFQLSGWMRSLAGVGQARLLVRNPRTGKRLSPSGAWVAAGSSDAGIDIFTESGTTWVSKSITAQVEDYQTCRADVVPLVVGFYCTDQYGVALFDDFLYTPGFNFVSVHGHNMEPFRRFRLLASDDGVNWSPVQTLTPRDPSFWGYNADEYHRHVKVVDLGTPSAEAGWQGEVVLGQAATSTIHPRMGYETQLVRRLVQNRGRGGEVRSHKESLFEERVLKLNFGLAGTKYDELRDEWFRRSDGGHFPMVVAPLDTEEDVFHGRIENSLSVRRSFITFREGDVLLTESPFPSVVE